MDPSARPSHSRFENTNSEGERERESLAGLSFRRQKISLVARRPPCVSLRPRRRFPDMVQCTFAAPDKLTDGCGNSGNVGYPLNAAAAQKNEGEKERYCSQCVSPTVMLGTF